MVRGDQTVRVEWVLLAYRLPREPSTPRISLWRNLRRLGAVKIVDGLIALPLDNRTREQLEWLADDVLEAGGEASVWVGEPGSAAQGRAFAERMATLVAEQYRVVAREAHLAAEAPSLARRRTLARLRRELARIEKRDFFPPSERSEARRAVELLSVEIERAVA